LSSSAFYFPQVQNPFIKNQKTGLNENESSNLFHYPEFDGILGLTYPNMAVENVSTVSGRYNSRASQFTQPIFSTHLSVTPLFSEGLKK
jgi:hypothetical protein